MEKRKATGFILTAGHLDIEWYQPLHSYRFWTIETFDQLKRAAREKDFGCYVLDGQVYPLDEYLAVRPDDKDEILQLIRDKKLAIGPFYTQFDEWLPSPENIIRNCLYGIRKAKAYGSCMYAGYLPDNFGHPLQLPQILKGFGIDSLLFMRGLPEIAGGHPDEFVYEGIDGSRITASHFRESYSSGAFDIFDKAVDPIQPRSMPYYEPYLSFEYHKALSAHSDPKKLAKDLIEKAKAIRDRYPSDVIPLIAGHDHLPPQVEVGRTVALANRMTDEIEFVMGDAKEYADLAASRMTDPKVYSMELLGSRYQYVLMGALTTRAYIKRENFACEALLERYAEPLLTYAGRLGYSRPMYDEAWMQMLLNSAHDSIHGSSTDEVHMEMMARYASVKQIAAGLCADALSHIAGRIRHWWREDGSLRGIVSFAPVSTADAAQVSELLICTKNRPFVIEREDGTLVTHQVLRREEVAENAIGKPEAEAYPDPDFERVLLSDTYDTQAFKSYRIRMTDKEPHADPSSGCYAYDNRIENEYLSVICNENGLIDIYDKRNETWYRNLNLLVDEADAGDAWDYSPAWLKTETVLSTQNPVRIRITESGPVRSTITIEGTMEVPKCLNGDRRSSEKTALPFTFFIRLLRGAVRVDVKLSIDNTANDHRLRLHMPSGIRTDHVLLQSQEAAIRRPVTLPETTEDWFQPPSHLLPFRDWSAVHDDSHGLAFAAKGLFEYEAIRDPYTKETELAYTLFRSIGTMGKLNMKQRSGGASMALPVPGAQCIGPQEIEWSYIPYACDEANDTPFLNTAHAFLYPPYSYAVRPELTGGTEALPEAAYTCMHPNIVFSALKPAADEEESRILRLYENQGRDGEYEIEIPDAEVVRRCNLNEEVLEEVALHAGKVRVHFGKYEMVTLKIR